MTKYKKGNAEVVGVEMTGTFDGRNYKEIALLLYSGERQISLVGVAICPSLRNRGVTVSP